MGCWVGQRAKGVRGIKEVTGRDEHWVLYVSDASLNSIPEKKILIKKNKNS